MEHDNNYPRGVPTLQFNPDNHPHSTLKAFEEFIEQYEFRYEAMFPEVQKHVLDNAIDKWKSENENPAVVTVAQKETIKLSIQSADKVRKLLGFFATQRLQQDWKAAEPDTAARNCTWEQFKTKMKEYYKPTENTTLRNYEFRHIRQQSGETFNAFCNRVEKEGRTCTFCECTADSACTSTTNAVRDQIVIGTGRDKIREQALLKAWGLSDLRKEGMKMESAARGEESMSSVADVSKVGAYSYKTLKQSEDVSGGSSTASSNGKKNNCFRCGEKFTKTHMRSCRASAAKCSNCQKVGHFSRVCRQRTGPVRSVNREEEDATSEDEVTEQVYELNIWAVKSGRIKYRNQNSADFKFHLIINNKLVNILADTGAKISVCGERQAAAWGM